MSKIPEIVHQNGHILASDKGKTFNKSYLKSSDSALSSGFNSFAILPKSTGDNKNKCKLCTKIFKNRDDRTTHIKVVCSKDHI